MGRSIIVLLILLHRRLLLFPRLIGLELILGGLDGRDGVHIF
jgi:hypothetical protein